VSSPPSSAVDPTLAAAWSNRGGALAALQHYSEALAAFDRALVLAPDFASAWHNEMVLLRALHRDAEAQAAETRVRALGLAPEGQWSPESEAS
jgi:tetratricopeptide (TPR) repeat protein